MMDDATLVRWPGRGTGAFAVLVGQAPADAGRCAGGLLGDSAPAEDAGQEAVLRAMLGLDGLERPERFGARLGGIGANVPALAPRPGS